MNTPGTATGNWTWQAEEDVFDERLAGAVRTLVADALRLGD